MCCRSATFQLPLHDHAEVLERGTVLLIVGGERQPTEIFQIEQVCESGSHGSCWPRDCGPRLRFVLARNCGSCWPLRFDGGGRATEVPCMLFRRRPAIAGLRRRGPPTSNPCCVLTPPSATAVVTPSIATCVAPVIFPFATPAVPPTVTPGIAAAAVPATATAVLAITHIWSSHRVCAGTGNPEISRDLLELTS